MPWRAPSARSYSGRLLQPGEVQAQAGTGPDSPATRAANAKLILILTATSFPLVSSYNNGQTPDDPSCAMRPIIMLPEWAQFAPGSFDGVSRNAGLQSF